MDKERFKAKYNSVLKSINELRGTDYKELKPAQLQILHSLYENPKKDVLAVLRTGYGIKLTGYFTLNVMKFRKFVNDVKDI